MLDRWRRDGAEAVLVVGSHARGTAGPASDVDVVVVGEGPHHRLEAHGGALVSVGWAPAEVQRARLYEPRYLATHVSGWREGLILYDPHGTAASIKEEARAWTWEPVAAACDGWAAETVAGYAEEVLKLVAALAAGDHVLAAAERSILVVHLALPIALRRRLLFSSENELWHRVASEVGEAWRDAQEAALGLRGGDVRASCLGALRLFQLAALDVDSLLDANQRAVVELGLEAARPLVVESG